MSDLTAFLLARLDEDEARARTTDTADQWPYLIWDETTMATYAERVLADVQAKRAIVKASPWANNADTGGAWTVPVGEFILRQMAAVYADHPDYREEWRP